MEVSKRFISAALATVMLASVCFPLTACKRKTSESKKVSEEDPWYTAKRIELDPKFDPEIYSNMSQTGPFMCQDKYVMTYDVSKRRSDDPDEPDIYEDLMGVFDGEGNLLHMIDLNEVMSGGTSQSSSGVAAVYPVLGFGSCENGMRLYYSDTFLKQVYSCDIDLDTGCKVGDKQTFDRSVVEDTKKAGLADDDFSVKSVSVIQGYELIFFTSYTTNRNKVVIAKDFKPIHCIDFTEEFGPGEALLLLHAFGIGNGVALIECFGKSNIWAKVELETGKVSRLTDGKPVSVTQKISTTEEGKSYISKPTGLYEYNPEKGEDALKINFDNCNVNRYETQNSSVLSFEENKVIIGCEPLIIYTHLLPDPAVIYLLEKAEKNPNAGKTLVTVASLDDYISNFEAEALKSFNEQNSEYYAKLILYDQSDYISAGDSSNDINEKDQSMYSAMAMVSGSLIADIRSGMAPDVVLGASRTVELLDSSYLMDLTPYLKNKQFDPSAYYSNIINATQMNGKMYYIPTSFEVAGIVTDGSKLESGQKGFTYEQYPSFVKEQLNGTEPVTQSTSRQHFMNLCVQRNYLQWLKKGKIDFNQEEFRELAGFFKENIPEGVLSHELELDAPENPEPKDAVFSEYIYGLWELAYSNYFGKNVKVMGLPSKDGTGPSAIICSSFSITEGTPVEEGAYAFLDILLSEDVQKTINNSIPVNRAAAVHKLETDSEDNRIGYSNLLRNNYYGTTELPSQEELRMQGLYNPSIKLDAIFLDMLETVDTVMVTDNPVLMIIAEEIPPYLIGQKDLDSIIPAINSRTQLVFKER